jgi:hypothetical protein
MEAEKIESTFARAGRGLRLCLLSEGPGKGRIVEAHAIFTSRTGRRLFHCFQVGGYSGGGEIAGWKNIDRGHIVSARVLDAPFRPRSEYRTPRPRQEPAPRLRLTRPALPEAG